MPRQIMVGLSPIAAAARSIREYGQREKAEALAAELRRIAEEERQFENSLATRKQDETERAARTGEGFEGQRVGHEGARLGYEGRRVDIAEGDFGMRQTDHANKESDRQELIGLTRSETDPVRRGVLDLKRLGVDTDRAFHQTPEERGREKGAESATAWQSGGRGVFADQSNIQTSNSIREINARESAQASGSGSQDALLAAAVQNDPELLTKLTPSDRARVLRTLQASGEALPNIRRNAMQNITQSARDALTQLMGSQEGMAGAVGAPAITQPGSWSRMVGAQPIPGSASAGFTKKIETLKARLALPKLEYLRGLGAMSDREFRAINDAVTSLDTVTSEADFRRELGNIDKAISVMEAQYGTAPQSGGGGRAAGAGPAGGSPSVGARQKGPDGSVYEFDGRGWFKVGG
jgi:hypothetical protein